jgi:hypothetical protein
MPWCVRTKEGRLWDHMDMVKDTKGAAIDSALAVFRGDPGVRGASRLTGWNWLKRTLGLSVVRVVKVRFALETVSERALGPARGMALCVLRGDHDAALALADLVLETYHAAKQEGTP